MPQKLEQLVIYPTDILTFFISKKWNSSDEVYLVKGNDIRVPYIQEGEETWKAFQKLSFYNLQLFLLLSELACLLADAIERHINLSEEMTEQRVMVNCLFLTPPCLWLRKMEVWYHLMLIILHKKAQTHEKEAVNIKDPITSNW